MTVPGIVAAIAYHRGVMGTSKPVPPAVDDDPAGFLPPGPDPLEAP